MATTNTKISYVIKLNNGIGPAGAIKTVSVSLGSISLTGANDTKASNIANAIENISTKSIYELQKVTYASVSE